MDKLVSIVIPVYNAEKYLFKCLNSVINQTYKNIEIILIDDYSTDSSFTICKKYESNDKRIRTMSSESKGVSNARNTGIKNSTGEFIQFVDSDDYIEKNATEIMVKEQEKTDTDLVVFGFRKVNGKNNITYISPISKEYNNKNEFIADNINKGLMNAIYGRLYKTKIINQNNIKFDSNMELGEDIIFNIDYLNYANKIVTKECSIYNYIIDNSFLTQKVRDDYVKERIQLIELMQDKLNNADSKLQYELDKKLMYIMVGCFEHIINKKNIKYKNIQEETIDLLQDKYVNKINKITDINYFYRLMKVNMIKKNYQYIYILVKFKKYAKKILNKLQDY